MQYDEELARMRAQMLAKEEEEPPVFDDGARFLGQDPNMMPVGFFGRPNRASSTAATAHVISTFIRAKRKSASVFSRQSFECANVKARCTKACRPSSTAASCANAQRY